MISTIKLLLKRLQKNFGRKKDNKKIMEMISVIHNNIDHSAFQVKTSYSKIIQ